MDLRALIFDVDGTLADTEEAHRQAFNAAFRDAGLDWSWDQALYRELLAVTGGRPRLRQYIERTLGLSEADADAMAGPIHARKSEIFQSDLTGGRVPLRPGVERLLREARGHGLRLAVATGSSRGNLAALLTGTIGAEAVDWFEVVGAADSVAALKPAPDIYHWVLGRLDLPAAACLAVEDSTAGVRAAGAAGVPVIVTECAYTSGDDFTGAVAVLADLGEPDRPFAVHHGDAAGRTCVDVALLRLWHAGSGQ